MVSAQINGQDAKLFIDTGAMFNMLGPSSAQKFGLKLGPLDPRIRVGGVTGEVNAHITTVKTLTFLGAPFDGVEFLVGEHGFGPADGLIGQNVLGGPDVEYDLANGIVRLFRSKDCGGAALAYWAQDGAVAMLPIVPMDQERRRIVGTATLNGVRLRVMFDSGAARSVLTVAGARRAGVRTDGPGVAALGVESGVGARVARSWTAPFQSFEIGGEQVQATRLQIGDLDLGDVDMLLGADFFLSHHLYISRTQSRVYFTYNGGPVFNLEQGASPPAQTPPAPQAATAASAPPGSEQAGPDAPKDAAGLARRAAAEMARHAYEAAAVDYTHAIDLEPGVAAHYFDRAAARTLNRQPIVAMADLDQALKLKPDYPAALVLRGELKLASRDQAGAAADFDAALRTDPEASVRIAAVYLAAGMFKAADGTVSASIDGHPRSEDLAPALALRCRARAFSGEGLETALKDCDDAIRLRPGTPEALASRGLVLLRQGKDDAAIADFNATLRIQPRSPWALMGRGIAEQRKGLKAQADADIAAAQAIAPKIPAEARQAGLAP
jgi:tetratricopeptide (TPR) repeat protein/predicted aspartyl protease